MERSSPGADHALPLSRLAAANTAACVVIALVLWPLLQEGFASILVHALSIGTLALLLITGTLRLLRRSRVGRGPFGIALRALLVPALGIVAYAAGTLIARRLLGLPPWPPVSLRDVEPAGREARSLIATVLASLVLTAGFVAWHRYSSLRLQAAMSRRMEERALRQASEARLAMLRAQIEPHMMFNTLATIRALIDIDPARADDMLDRFIVFLRATLGGSCAPTVELRAEFDMLENYLSLWKFRLADRLRYRLVLASELDAYAIPSLLLQPLVENAVRHGIEPAVGGGSVAIVAELVRNEVIVTVTDTGSGIGRDALRRIASAAASVPDGADAPDAPGGSGESGGFGLRQLASRLSTYYGPEASFSIDAPEAGGTRIELRLPPRDGIPAPHTAGTP